ncbi:MAG TPA: tetratricopeptide repeat protein [Pyrinomonadaceae bacterium]|jgi:protein involved in polysaccharide export with SLBB domain/Tfp pilus assembly protein PilF
MKKILLFALLACATCVSWTAARAAQGGLRGEVYYRDGARFALEGRLAEAAKAFEQAVALDPSNGNAFYALGNVYAEMGRWADAVNAYYKAVSLNKEDVEALNNLGVALRMRGQNVQAAGAFERAVKIYPKWAEPFYHLSETRRALGQPEEAREAYERALRLRPDYATRPPRPFANARAQTAPAASAAPPAGQILKAMDAVGVGGASEKVASSPATAPEVASDVARDPAPAPSPSPSAPPAAANPAPRDAATARPAPARPAAVEAAPSPYDLGVRESRAGRHREAVAAFRQAVLLERRNAAAYRGLGDAYAALGEWRESVDAYEQAARLDPDDTETYQKLGRSYAKLREAGAPAAGAGDATPTAERPSVELDADPTAVYRVGPGDVLDVRILKGADPRTTSYKVTPTGLLDYPALREPLPVAGLTTEQAAERLGAALKLRAAGDRPEVAVGVREYASHAVIVGGMVKEPGTKILQREGVPLYVIVAHAQPLAGAGEAVVVSRATGRTLTADLADAEAMKALVRPGDVVTLRALPKRFVYVAGAVREPGQREFHTGMTLTQAVLAAGGATAAGDAPVAVTRQGDDGRLSTSRFSLAQIRAGRVPDPALRPGDRIEVLTR